MKRLSVTSSNFLKKLDYWISRGKYGREYDDKIWIYNTLEDWAEQLGVSKSTFQRHIKKLLEEGIVETAYLAKNRRDRTLSYTINYEKLNCFVGQNTAKRQSISRRVHMVKIKDFSEKIEHMVDHMIYVDNNNKIYKSYKSGDNVSGDIASPKNFPKKISAPKAQAKSSQEHNEEMVGELIAEQIPKEKPDIVQRMVKSLINIFHGFMKTFRLTKAICRNLVAAFQRKFHNSIEEWEKYLKLIKTSTYLMGGKFKLSIHWILKFITIDRILNGEFGVNPDKITYTEKEKEKMAENKKQQIQHKIAEINEPEICKQTRIKLLDILGVDDYQQYFENPNKCRFIERNDEITVELLGSEPWDFFYKKQKLERIFIKAKWINDYIKAVDKKGHETYGIARSFNELEQVNTSKPQPEIEQQNDEGRPNKPLWKRIF